MSYNISQLQASTDVLDLVSYANTHSGQVLAGIMMFGIFFVFILLFKSFGFIKAIATSSFICFALSFYLVYAKLLSFYVLLVFLVLLAFSILYLYMAGASGTSDY